VTTSGAQAHAIRTVHVGARGRGSWPVALLAADTRFEPVALVGREPAALADALSTAQLEPSAAFRSLEAALADVDADAVVVCTPVELHARDLRTAFAAGKHVLVEKCLSADWREACALVAEAEAAGVELVVAQNYRYRPETMALAEALGSGRYGAASLVDLTLHKYRPAPRQQNYAYAMFWDQGCHHADDLQSLHGPITEVAARTFSTPWSRYRDDAAMQALLRFESGATCAYLLSNVSKFHSYRHSVQTERGVLDWAGDGWLWHEAMAPDDAPFGWNAPPVAVESATGIPETPEHGVVDTFHRAVTTRAPTELSGRANLETLRVCEMVRRSGNAGRPVRRDEVADA
jgi:predicted dehydrogenase